MLKRYTISMLLVVLVFIIGENSGFAFEQEDTQIHGFASQGYLYSSGKEFVDDTEDGTWEFDEIGLNLTMPLMDRLRFGIQFFMRDLGNMGNNEFKVDWAYIDYSWRDWLGLRAAKIKLPWGLYNKTRDVDSLRGFIFLPESVYYEGLREFLMSAFGASVYGTIDAGAAGFIDYEAYAGTTDFNEFEGMELDDTKMYGGGIFWSTPVSGLKVGGTALNLKVDTNLLYETGLSSPSAIPGLYQSINVNYTGGGELGLFYVLSMQYEYKNFVFAMEYADTESKFEMTSDNPLFAPDIESKMNIKGWYSSITWRALEWLELGAYYDVIDMDSNSAAYQGVADYFTYRKDVAICTRFNINEYMTFKLESHFVNGLADIDETPATLANTDKRWEYYAAKIGVSF